MGRGAGLGLQGPWTAAFKTVDRGLANRGPSSLKLWTVDWQTVDPKLQNCGQWTGKPWAARALLATQPPPPPPSLCSSR